MFFNILLSLQSGMTLATHLAYVAESPSTWPGGRRANPGSMHSLQLWMWKDFMAQVALLDEILENTRLVRPEAEAGAAGLTEVASLQARLRNLTRTLRDVLDGAPQDRSPAKRVEAGGTMSAPPPVGARASTAAPPDPAVPRWSPPPPERYEHLIGQGLLTHEQLTVAAAEASDRRIAIESVLMDKYAISEANIADTISLYYGHPFVLLDDAFVPSPELMEGLCIEELRAGAWLPIARDGDAITVLVDDPRDRAKTDAIEKAFAGSVVRLAVGIRENILISLVVGWRRLSASRRNLRRNHGVETLAEVATG